MLKLSLLLCSIVVIGFHVFPVTCGEHLVSQSISNTLDPLLENYDPMTRPNYGGEPVIVGVTMYVLSLTTVSENLMEWGVDMYLRQNWKDPRLAFTPGKGEDHVLTVPAYPYNNKIWKPDTFIVNSKGLTDHSFHLTDESFLRISSAGDVLFSKRISGKASCPMDLRYYPFDTQICTLEIESFVYTMSDVRYRFQKGMDSVGVSSDVTTPEWKVLGHRQQAMELTLSTGNYSRIAVEVQLVRNAGYHSKTVFVPLGLMVLFSWAALLVKSEHVVVRVIVSISSLTGILIIGYLSWVNQPHIGYLRAVDVYIIGCVILVGLVWTENLLFSLITPWSESGGYKKIQAYGRTVTVSAWTLEMVWLLLLFISFLLFHAWFINSNVSTDLFSGELDNFVLLQQT